MPKCTFNGGAAQCRACSAGGLDCNPCAGLMRGDFRRLSDNLTKVKRIDQELLQYPKAMAKLWRATNNFVKTFLAAEIEHCRLFNPWGTGLVGVAHRQAYQQMVISMRQVIVTEMRAGPQEPCLRSGDPLYMRLRAAQKAFEYDVNAAIDEVLAELKTTDYMDAYKIRDIRARRFPEFNMYYD